MREKKFPLVPLAVMGVAIVGGAIMISNKPLVGDMETVMKEKERRNREAIEEQARNKVAGDSRSTTSDAQLKNELAASLKTPNKEPDGEEGIGNSGIRQGEKVPLILFGVRKTIKKAQVNEAMTATGWYRPQYRGDKK
jgi:hypothetical protein